MVTTTEVLSDKIGKSWISECLDLGLLLVLDSHLDISAFRLLPLIASLVFLFFYYIVGDASPHRLTVCPEILCLAVAEMTIFACFQKDLTDFDRILTQG